MADAYEYPKLRWPIDIRMEEVDDGRVLLLNCPIGISAQPLALVSAVAPIVGCFEGHLSISEITAKFQNYGIQRELVEKLVELLDTHLFLATPRFFAAERESKELFAKSKVRPAALAGAGYSLNARTLERQIDQYLSSQNGSEAASTTPTSRNMLGLVSPHIDYRRGGIAYGLTYRHLTDQQHTTYILIGTAHQFSKHLFHLSAKDFETPLGVLPCDVDFVTTLAQGYGLERSFADEILHRREHSLELQLPFLQRTREDCRMVPILVGSFHDMLISGRQPHEFDHYEAFASSLSECIRQRIVEGQKVAFIAGVDMAHVGQNFGDKEKLTPEFMEQIALRDQVYLDAIVKHDKKMLFEHIAEDLDQRRICGFPSMYTVLDVLERLNLRYSAQIFDYRQAVDYQTDCAVTFAGIGLYQI